MINGNVISQTHIVEPNQSKITRTTIKIGALGPLSLNVGQDMKHGMDLAVSEINQNGVTVGGTVYDLEIDYGNTSGTNGLPDNATTLTSLNALKSNGVVSIIGGFTTNTALTIQYQIGTIPFIGIGSTTPIISPYFWRVGPTNGTEIAYSLIEFYHIFMESLGVRNITIIREDSNWAIGTAKGIKGAFTYYFPTDNFTFSSDVVIPINANQNTVTSYLSALNGTATNAFLELFETDVGKLVTTAWSKLNMTQYLAGVNIDSQESNYFNDTYGNSYGEIELEPRSLDLSSALSDTFKSSYLSTYGEDPSFTSYISYDAVYVLKNALEICSSPSASQVQLNLNTTDYVGTSYRIKFTNDYQYPQYGIDSAGNQAYLSNVNYSTKIYVHDLYTPDAIGTSSQEYVNNVFVQWQKNGIKKEIYSNVSTFGVIGTTTMQWPIIHSESGYTTPVTTTSASQSTTSLSTSVSQSTSQSTSLSNSFGSSNSISQGINPLNSNYPEILILILITFLTILGLIFIRMKSKSKSQKANKENINLLPLNDLGNETNNLSNNINEIRREKLFKLMKRSTQISAEDFMQYLEIKNKKNFLDWLVSLPINSPLYLDKDTIIFKNLDRSDFDLNKNIDELLKSFNTVGREKL